ncbi:hypothetical protein ACFFX0_14190 [Citricoccus parietis]|uniref:Secreted protein n=1 Tax=Citricoccus parietis TaxID=592307 RepID=A0ABV5G041_9MICC
MLFSRCFRLMTAFSSWASSDPRASTSASRGSSALMLKYFIRYLMGSALALRTTWREQLCTLDAVYCATLRSRR